MSISKNGFELELRLMILEDGKLSPFLSRGGVRLPATTLSSSASRITAKLHVDQLLTEASIKMKDCDYPIHPIGDLIAPQQLRMIAEAMERGEISRTDVRMAEHNGKRILQIDFKHREP